jgi:hypothetical protein
MNGKAENTTNKGVIELHQTNRTTLPIEAKFVQQTDDKLKVRLKN